jgi:hypothetical protein
MRIHNETYQLPNMYNFFCRGVRQTFLKSWYHVKQMIEYPMLPMFPGKPVKVVYLLDFPKDVLKRESAIRLIAKLTLS